MSKVLQLPRLEPTEESVFLNRRRFVQTALLAGAGTCLYPSLGCSQPPPPPEGGPLALPFERPEVFPAKRNAGFDPPNLELTDRLVAATHNNFYEFLPNRGGPVWKYTSRFEVEPWKVEVSGECQKPRTFDLDDLFGFEQEERVYRFRCVETWAMNIPWTGFPLSKLLKDVQPTAKARHVRFITAHRPAQMPGLSERHYPWPYYEALRLDEAMNDLTLAVTGVYGKPLLKQHGAPVRIIVPWKYGYKSPKSIVKIELVAKKPGTFWSAKPYQHEYGYLSNVNPNVPHPRWSQEWDYMLVANAAPRRGPRRPTLMFNGYADQVGHLYPDEPTKPQRSLRRGQTAR
ncbi:MAG: protein-methionine-sulfoxide reductase catalytic subunit MsrP [Acidobacteriota bacterium]|nr:protein-methionine-sulfoxide reductase catalytic subunit MsrP [Acidobacteriota bacterium]